MTPDPKPSQACRHFPCGKAGAGKSTLAQALGSRHLTEDEFRHISSYFEALEPDEGFRIEVHQP